MIIWRGPYSIVANIALRATVAAWLNFEPKTSSYLVYNVLQSEARIFECVLKAVIGVFGNQFTGYSGEKVPKLNWRRTFIAKLSVSRKANDLVYALCTYLLRILFPDLDECHWLISVYRVYLTLIRRSVEAAVCLLFAA
jgi:hypothetical protein